MHALMKGECLKRVLNKLTVFNLSQIDNDIYCNLSGTYAIMYGLKL